MNRAFGIIIGILIVLGITVSLILYIKYNKPQKEVTLDEAIMEFKSHPGFRTASAKEIIPYLKIGMSLKDVNDILGKPDKERKYGDILIYNYDLYYSLRLSVHFDPNGYVKEIIYPQGL